jgi:hypothetical protein
LFGLAGRSDILVRLADGNSRPDRKNPFESCENPRGDAIGGSCAQRHPPCYGTAQEEVMISACADTVGKQHMLNRVRGEFLEMPGLRLRVEQAQRLWGLDRQTCQDLLSSLVDAKFLARRADDAYSLP